MTEITNDQNIKAWSSVSDGVIKNFGDHGDFSRQHQLNPAMFSLLGDVHDKKILDAGSGTGYLSRLLAKKGAHVTAIEPASPLFRYAVAQEKKTPLGIVYMQEDLSGWKCTPNYFDVVVSNMVFMDIPDYQAAMKNCIDSLVPNGIFIFSILHPCFENDVDWRQQPYVKTEEYFKEYPVQQFTGHFIHRLLSSYVNLLIENGCTIEKIVEPQLSREISRQYPQQERSNHVPLFMVIKSRKENKTIR